MSLKGHQFQASSAAIKGWFPALKTEDVRTLESNTNRLDRGNTGEILGKVTRAAARFTKSDFVKLPPSRLSIKPFSTHFGVEVYGLSWPEPKTARVLPFLPIQGHLLPDRFGAQRSWFEDPLASRLNLLIALERI